MYIEIHSYIAIAYGSDWLGSGLRGAILIWKAEELLSGATEGYPYMGARTRFNKWLEWNCG